MRTIALGLGVAAAALAFSGCSTSEEQAADNTVDANAEVCDAVQNLGATLSTSLTAASESVSGDSEVTVGQAEDAADTLASQWESAKGALEDRNQAVSEQLNIVLDKDQDTVSSIKDNKDLSLKDAASQLRTAQTTLNSDLEQIANDVGC